MLFYYLFLYVLLNIQTTADISKKYPYKLIPIYTQEAYQKSIAGKPYKKLVLLKNLIPDIILDLRYATKNNFTKTVIYPSAKAFARKIVADSLAKIQTYLRTKGLGLKIYDAYRPYTATIRLYASYPNKIFLAHPRKGSRHNRACALDLTLIDIKSGKELIMPTEFDSFSKKAFPKALLDNETAKKNRDFLIQTMEKYGFKVSLSEWWHFDFKGYTEYEILDIPFTNL